MRELSIDEMLAVAGGENPFTPGTQAYEDYNWYQKSYAMKYPPPESDRKWP